MLELRLKLKKQYSNQDWRLHCKLLQTNYIQTKIFSCEKNRNRQILVKQTKGIYNRLPLVICLILDIDMALGSLSLPWEVKSNKSWTTIFAIGA